MDGFQHLRNPGSLLSSLVTPAPWQHLYRKTVGRRHLACGPAQWSILSATTESFDPITFNPQEMTRLTAPSGGTWADPFLWSVGDARYVFVEEWFAGASCAHLSAVRLDSDGLPIGLPNPIISSATHYSYPFIFEHEGQLWMLPENSASGRLQLYRCLDFPYRWVPDRVLMEGTMYADPTLLEFNGVWWMFITLKTGFYGLNSNLFLFHAADPISDRWKPHPLNPIVSGFHHSRPAGRVFVSKGRLYRPAQDCFKRYGNGLRINEITRLDHEHYQETCVRKIHPWKDDIVGVHHLEISGNLVMMDIHTLLDRAPA